MSHRAAVAFPTADAKSPDLVDLHRSGNGAFQLSLLPILDEYTKQGNPRRVTELNELPDSMRNRVAELRDAFGNEPETEPLVDPTPMRRELLATEYAEALDFVRFEALYDVPRPPDGEAAESNVAAYLPIFADIGIIPFLIRFVDLAVYPNQELPAAPDEALQEIQNDNATPDVTISGTEYLELENDPTAKEHVIDGHMGLLQMLYSLPHGETDDEVLTIVTTDNHFIVGTVDASGEVPLPDPFGAGVLVRLPTEDFATQQLATLHSDWQYLANRLRVEHSIRALQELLDGSGIPSAEDIDGATYREEFLTALDDEFGQELSPLTPTEFHPELDSL